MPEINPLELIAECMRKCLATTDRDAIGHMLAETLGALQIDNTEEDSIHMLGTAVAETADRDKVRGGDLLEVWTELTGRGSGL